MTLAWRPRLRITAGFAMTLGAMLSAGPAAAMQRGADLPPPNLDDYVVIDDELADGDGDGVKETQIRHYGNLAGDRIFSMTSDGILWAWSLEGHGGGGDPEHNYVIRDSDCDGAFDERYGLDEEFNVPECAK